VKRGEVAFAALILALSAGYLGMALAMPRGRLAYPGPGFYPLMVGTFLLTMAAGGLLQALARRRIGTEAPAGEGAASGGTGHSLARPLQLLGLLLVYALLLSPLGFVAAMTLFLLAAIAVFGYRRWLPLLVMGSLIMVVAYATFILWLKVPLPAGLLGDLLGG